jgi:hypothetical protein
MSKTDKKAKLVLARVPTAEMAASLFSATHYSIKPRHERAHQRRS